MSTLFLTLTIAFVVILTALGFLGISWLMTGKLNIRPGACSRDPTKSRNDEEGCGTDLNCNLCKTPEEKKKNTETNDKL